MIELLKNIINRAAQIWLFYMCMTIVVWFSLQHMIVFSVMLALALISAIWVYSGSFRR